MSTTLPEQDVTPEEAPVEKKLPDASHLEDHTPAALRAPRVLPAFAVFLGVLYVFLCSYPLWHTDLWGHLAYGRYICETGSIPKTEPLMPLSVGVRFADTAWLSQVLGYQMFEKYSYAGLQFLYAITIVASVALLLWRAYRRTSSYWWSLLAGLVFLVAEWKQLNIARPQLAGLCCYMAVLTIMTYRKWSPAVWLILPAIFALWANLHGSFVAGLLLLGCFAVGRSVDVLIRTRNIRAVWRDDRARRAILLTELAIVATLLNPLGYGIYAEILAVSGHPNFEDLLEWDVLSLRMLQGQGAAVLSIILVFVYRLTPRRISATEAFAIIGFLLSAMWVSRMIVWWVPPTAYFLSLHSAAIWRKYRHLPLVKQPSTRAGKWTLITAGLIWIFFGFSTFGGAVLRGTQPPPQVALSQLTPLGATEYLNKHHVTGQLFNTYEWGDYLIWAGPKDAQVLVASHAHLVPRWIWRHYMQVIKQVDEWQELFDRYSVNTIILDKLQREKLIKSLRREEGWKVGYEDSISVVFHRRKPITID